MCICLQQCLEVIAFESSQHHDGFRPLLCWRFGMLRTILTVIALASVCPVLSVLSVDWAYGSQLTKGNKLVLEKREVRNFERPRQNGNRLAFCTADGHCGKRAADEFCRGSDFEGALTFQRDRTEGHSAKLRFLRIKCWRTSGNPAAKQASRAEKNEPLSNTLTKSNRR